MSLKITDPAGAVGRVQVSLTGVGTTEITHSDAQEALEDLARILGFSLVDREERRSLTELVGEVRGLATKAYASAADASISFEKAGEALANAVADTLDFCPKCSGGRSSHSDTCDLKEA